MKTHSSALTGLFQIAIAIAILLPSAAATAQEVAKEESQISYFHDVRPILTAKCFGCHQGNIQRGDYQMTNFESLLAGGESGDPAIIAGKPEQSYLIDLIKKHDGKAEMPPQGEQVTEKEFALIQRWIREGAKNDSLANIQPFNNDNPPVYDRQPLISTLDVSPDGKWIAVSGYHEVILIEVPDTAATNLSAEQESFSRRHRLIGLSSRIEKLRFSPDGKRLAVAGGRPAEFGEVQVWDVETKQQVLSKMVADDTVFGVNWSHDGKLLSFGCSDTTLRAIDSTNGNQVLFQGAHDDWVLDTVFSLKSNQLVSVGRDMSCKLVDVPTQRFIDNITSITPGVLKGGISSVARHPADDVVAIGGADGVPRIYRMNRLTKRVIGDDANLIREFSQLKGRINCISISSDGKRLVAASSLDGKGYISVYSLDFNLKMPEEIKKIVAKRVSSQNADEKKKLKEYVTGAPPVATWEVDTPIYAIDWLSGSDKVIAGGADGKLRVLAAGSKLISMFDPVKLDKQSTNLAKYSWTFKDHERPSPKTENVVPDQISELIVYPKSVSFGRPTDYSQLVVMAKTLEGSLTDVTYQAEMSEFDDSVVRVVNGLVEPLTNGETKLKIKVRNLVQEVPIVVEFGDDTFRPDFVRDVNPVLTKLGCNAGTCHGSQGGKKGFKLSLRGYDPLYDVRSFTDELGSRRVNLNAAHESLMLLKPSATVAHEGGRLLKTDDKYYSLIRKWIADGAKLDLSVPSKVISIEVFPKNPVVEYAGSFQQLRVLARIEGRSTVDVTHEAVLESGNLEVANVVGSQLEALRRGEAPILVRYEGAFTSTTLTVMGDRSGYQWEQPETWNEIDSLVANKWKRVKLQPSELCSDAEFVRRIHLDLTGLPPSVERVKTFIEDQRETKIKRYELIERLIGNEAFVEHWSNKWADLMQVNRKYLGSEGSMALRTWLQQQVRENRPYDEFAREILTASGSNKDNPPAAYYKIHRSPEDAMENTTHLFLATRFNCNKCHDHPFERWTQDQYYELAAYFAQIKRAPDPQSKNKKIAGSAVESAKPLYEIISDQKQGEIVHVRTGEVTPPRFPMEVFHDNSKNLTRRELLANWITSPMNPYFATSYVNRLWGYLNGVGLIEPLDDIRAGNPPTNPELLEYLRDEFIDSNFDTRHIIRLICQSRTYQLSVATNEFNQDDQINFSHALARRLPAEVLFDSIHAVTGSQLKIPGVKPGTRAAELPDSGVKLPSGFLATLGRPARESVCECERSSDLQLGSVLAFVSGPDLAKAINDNANEIANLVKSQPDDKEVIKEVFLRVLNRPATAAEINLALDAFSQIKSDHEDLLKQRDQRSKWFAEEKPKLEAQREESIRTSKSELEAAIQKLDSQLLKKESEQKAAAAKAEQRYKEYAATAASFEQWKTKQLREVNWHPLVIHHFDSKMKRKFEIRADRSVILSKEQPGKDVGIAYASTDLTGISHVRLEVLSDPKLPNKGPGLAENGNFVLSEFEVEIADPKTPKKWTKVEIESAKADYNQGNFLPKMLFDGNKDASGWAVHPETSKTHWVTMKLKLPIGFHGQTLLRFRMTQNYDENHQVGCFRISVSKFHGQMGASLSEEFLAKLSLPQQQLEKGLRAKLEAYAKAYDPKLQRLERAMVAAKKPVAVHPEILKARKKLARMERPVPMDATLAELEKNVVASTKQLENARLTATQDLTWALINSPAFLFNH